jgi:trehalose-phosphatase
MIFEIQPGLGWNKGSAVLWLLRTLGLDGPDVVPVYIGDDITDEDAFAVIKTSGIGFFVNAGGETDPGRATAANYAVEGPAEVGLLLRFLVERPLRRS